MEQRRSLRTILILQALVMVAAACFVSGLVCGRLVVAPATDIQAPANPDQARPQRKAICPYDHGYKKFDLGLGVILVPDPQYENPVFTQPEDDKTEGIFL